MSEGAEVRIVPDGYVPEAGSGVQESHETTCVLNAPAREARLSISFHFEDRDPTKGVPVVVVPERTRHAPVTVRHSRMDTTQAALWLTTTLAYPVARR